MIKFISKNGWLIIIQSIMVFYGCVAPSGLDKKWPDYKHLRRIGDGTVYYLSAPVREGYIFTKNKDTLKGYIKIFNYNKLHSHLLYFPLLPFNKTKATDIIDVKLEDIDFIRVKRPNSNDSEDYGLVDSNTWLLIGRKNQIKIYYQQWWNTDVDGILFIWIEMILVSEKERTEIPTRALIGSHPRWYYLLQFINKRYGQDFKQEDFKDEKAMIGYILDKENQKPLNN